jgi:hypothetical protein
LFDGSETSLGGDGFCDGRYSEYIVGKMMTALYRYCHVEMVEDA